MIVKNEEMNIERALAWAKDIAFEQIVVDTGSTDRTVEIAKRMGAKVFHFKWIDDFSAAKNYALDQASGDWIAFLDADEYIIAEHARLIIPLIENIINLNGSKAVALTSQLAQLRDDGSIFQIERQQRIFINHPDVRYERQIHETLNFPGETFPVLENDILIMHTGYSIGAYAKTNKLERNTTLLKKALESNPKDVKSKYHLANEFCLSGNNIEEALILFRELLNETTCQKNAYNWFRIRAFYRLITHMLYNTNAYSEAYTLAEQAFHESPDHVNICCLYGISMYYQGQFKNALDAFKKAEKLVLAGKIENLSFDNIDTLNTYLAQTCIMLDNPDEALRYAVSYLQSHRQHENMLTLCIRVLRSKKNPEDVVSFLSNIYDFKNILDKMFLLRCAKNIGDIALVQLFIEMITPEEFR
jgi:glycosyltransferase involved in cell wall biosynthesis